MRTIPAETGNRTSTFKCCLNVDRLTASLGKFFAVSDFMASYEFLSNSLRRSMLSWPENESALKSVNNCFNTNIYSYLETSGAVFLVMYNPPVNKL